MNYSTTQHRIFNKNYNPIKDLEDKYSGLIDVIVLGIVAFLCLIGFIFSVEMVIYTIYCCIGIAICLLSSKIELLIYIIPFMYIVPSIQNNPALNDQSIFSSSGNIIYLVCLALILIALVIYRIIRDHKGKKFHLPQLTFGFILLGLSYYLSGFGSGYESMSNCIYGLAEVLSLCLTYFMAIFAVDWNRVPKSGFAWMGLFIGLAIVFEVFYIYISQDSSILQIAYDRGTIYAGWGMYNNIGGYLIMTIPCAFYLACTERNGWLYLIFGFVLYGGVMLTTSRGALLTGSGILLLSCVVALIAAKGKKKKIQIGVTLGLFAIVGIIALIILLKDEGIGSIIDRLIYLEDNGRFAIYKQGIEQFLEHPIFGAGFYECDVYQFGFVEIAIPPRWHNTIVQLLATGGVVCLIAYLYHRAETVVMIAKKRTLESVFIALCILALIISSLVDNHIFNFGPGFLYGAYLAFAEGLPKERKEVCKF
ncbi:MAG: O-antigen ligase family protein [Clostridia bacterium]|nr:O-antigen ligase family protein [Clostridia bacterium]